MDSIATIQQWENTCDSAAPIEAERHDVIVLGTVKWDVVRSVGEYTVAALVARGHRVLFVEPFNSLYTLAREARWQKRSLGKLSGLRQVGERLWVLSPAPIGLAGASRARWPTRVNGWILGKIVARHARKLGFVDPIVWSFMSNSASAGRHIPGRLKVYECREEDSAMARSERQRRIVQAHEADLCRSVDLVFAVTAELADRRREFNHNTFEVNCAAKADFFGQALDPDLKPPPDIASLPRPVLGYMGGLDPWKMDVELLTHIARNRPGWSIAMVGYVWFGFDPAPLKALPNIHVLGPKPYEQFPAYLKAMDVCLMPFPLNAITLNGDALKCYEYLSAGKPVVSTPVPVAKRLSELVRIARTPDEFLAAIEASLNDRDAAAVQRRVSAIRAGHTWEHRVDQKLALIAQTLRQKQERAQMPAQMT